MIFCEKCGKFILWKRENLRFLLAGLCPRCYRNEPWRRRAEYAYIFDVFTTENKVIALALGDNFKFLVLRLKSSETGSCLRKVYVGSDINKRSCVEFVKSPYQSSRDIRQRLRENLFSQKWAEHLIENARDAYTINGLQRHISGLKDVINLGLDKELAKKFRHDELAKIFRDDLRKLLKTLQYKMEWIKDTSTPLRCDSCGTVLKGLKKRRGWGRKTFTQTEEMICPRCGRSYKVR